MVGYDFFVIIADRPDPGVNTVNFINSRHFSRLFLFVSLVASAVLMVIPDASLAQHAPPKYFPKINTLGGLKVNQLLLPIKFNAQQEDFKIFQRGMRQLGFYNGPIDGIMGPGTADGIRRFMRSAGLRGGVTENNLETMALILFIVDGRGVTLGTAMQSLPDARRAILLETKLYETFSDLRYAETEAMLAEFIPLAEKTFGTGSIISLKAKSKLATIKISRVRTH